MTDMPLELLRTYAEVVLRIWQRVAGSIRTGYPRRLMGRQRKIASYLASSLPVGYSKEHSASSALLNLWNLKQTPRTYLAS